MSKSFVTRAFYLLLLLLVLQRVIVFIVFNLNYTDNDQTLVWLMAKDYSHGIFHQPFMYGQDYNYMLEAFLAAPLLWCGVSVDFALPVVANLLAIAPFVSFGLWFLRREKFNAAIILLVIPLLLPNSYAMITSMPRGFVNGLALFSFWPWIESVKRGGLRFTLFGFILAAAFVMNPNVIFIAVFLGGLVFYRAEKKRLAVQMMLVGATVPALLHLTAKMWAHNHQSEIIHASWGLEWTFDYFKNAFAGNLYSFFRGVVPFTEDYSHFMWFIFPAIMLMAFMQKRYELAVVLGFICAGIIFSFGVNKVNDGVHSVYFPLSRMFLALPLVLALVSAELFADKMKAKVLYVTLIATGLFFGLQLQQLNPVIEAEVQVKEIPLSIASIDNLRFQTEQLNNFAATNSITYFAGAGYPMKFGDLQLIFHAGEAWYDNYPECSVPEYERRRWMRELVLKHKANTTAWFGGDEALWTELDRESGVVAYDILDLKAYVVQGQETNQQVFGFLGKAILSGE